MSTDLLSDLQDPDRLHVLQESGLLNPDDDPALNRVTRLAAMFLEAPLALVNIITPDQQLSRSRYALTSVSESRSTSLQDSFCKYPVLKRQPLVVEDARVDPTLSTSRPVREDGVTAYAAVPLITPDGHALGTLCVVDFVPRSWDDRQLQILSDLAESVLTEIELRRDLWRRKRTEELLREREEALRLIVEGAHDAFVIMTGEGHIAAWNLQAEQTFGWRRDEVMGRVLSEVLILPSDRARHEQGLVRFFESGRSVMLHRRVELLALHRDGHSLPIELTITPIRVGSQVIFSAFLHDISARKQTEASIERYTATVRLLQRISTAANEAGRFEDVLQQCLNAICVYTGWPAGHAYRMSPLDRLLPTNIWALDEPEAYADLRRDTAATTFTVGQGLPGRVLSSGRPEWVVDLKQDLNVVRPSLRGSSELHAALAFPVLVGAEIVAVLEFFSPDVKAPDEALLEVMANIGTQLGRVVERERLEAKLRADALRDAATGLSNRLGFFSLAEQQLTLARRMDQEVALFFIDLDGMKQINDTLGHQMGDAALVETAHVLKQTFRASDIVGRLGGDEFVVFALDVPQGRMNRLLQRFEQNLAEANAVPGRPFTLRMSVGVVDERAQRVTSIEDLVEEADRRMYQQKHTKADGQRRT